MCPSPIIQAHDYYQQSDCSSGILLSHSSSPPLQSNLLPPQLRSQARLGVCKSISALTARCFVSSQHWQESSCSVSWLAVLLHRGAQWSPALCRCCSTSWRKEKKALWFWPLNHSDYGSKRFPGERWPVDPGFLGRVVPVQLFSSSSQSLSRSVCISLGMASCSRISCVLVSFSGYHRILLWDFRFKIGVPKACGVLIRYSC